MTLQECYKKMNGDYEDVKSRLSSDGIIELIMLEFPADPSFTTLKNGVDQGDAEQAFTGVHTLKSVAGNLGFKGLENAALALTEQLRSRKETADPVLFEKVEQEYNIVVKTLKEYAAAKSSLS